MVTSPRCFPYTTTCLRVRQSPKGKDYVVRDTVLELGPPSGISKEVYNVFVSQEAQKIPAVKV